MDVTSASSRIASVTRSCSLACWKSRIDQPGPHCRVHTVVRVCVMSTVLDFALFTKTERRARLNTSSDGDRCAGVNGDSAVTSGPVPDAPRVLANEQLQLRS